MLALGEDAADVDEHRDRVGRDELALVPGRERAVEVRRVAEGEVQLVALQRAERAGEVAAHAELDDEARLLARGVADEPRRRVQLAPDVDAQRRRRRLADVGDGAVGDLEHPPRGGEEALAGRGERDPAAVALEEAAERRPRAARRAWRAPAG